VGKPMNRDRIIIGLGALVAFLLQIIIAPNIALFSATPNFILVYVLAVVLIRFDESLYVLAFVLGLLLDLLGTGPVGVTPFLLVALAFLVSRAYILLNNDTFFIPLAILVIAIALAEIGYAVALLALGALTGVIDALAYLVLPGILYNGVIGIVAYPLLARLIFGTSATSGDSSVISSTSTAASSAAHIHSVSKTPHAHLGTVKNREFSKVPKKRSYKAASKRGSASAKYRKH
jgi:rod shape-determining protein MreD